MNTFGLGAVKRVVNRVVDAEGKRVPFEAMYSGEAFWINDHVDLPEGVARVVIQQSMFKMGPDYGIEYRLGCAALGAPEDPIPVEETQRLELYDRGPNAKMQAVRNNFKIRRMESLYPRTARAGADGSTGAGFGDGFSR